MRNNGINGINGINGMPSCFKCLGVYFVFSSKRFYYHPDCYHNYCNHYHYHYHRNHRYHYIHGNHLFKSSAPPNLCNLYPFNTTNTTIPRSDITNNTIPRSDITNNTIPRSDMNCDERVLYYFKEKYRVEREDIFVKFAVKHANGECDCKKQGKICDFSPVTVMTTPTGTQPLSSQVKCHGGVLEDSDPKNDSSICISIPRDPICSQLGNEDYVRALYRQGTLDSFYNYFMSVTQRLRQLAGRKFERFIERVLDEEKIPYARQVYILPDNTISKKKPRPPNKNVKKMKNINITKMDINTKMGINTKMDINITKMNIHSPPLQREEHEEREEDGEEEGKEEEGSDQRSEDSIEESVETHENDDDYSDESKSKRKGEGGIKSLEEKDEKDGKDKKKHNVHVVDFLIPPPCRDGMRLEDYHGQIVSIKTSNRERYLQDTCFSNFTLISLEKPVCRKGIRYVQIREGGTELTQWVEELKQNRDLFSSHPHFFNDTEERENR